MSDLIEQMREARQSIRVLQAAAELNRNCKLAVVKLEERIAELEAKPDYPSEEIEGFLKRIAELEPRNKVLEDELERLTADLDKCREGSAIRTRINDKQVARIKVLEDVLVAAKLLRNRLYARSDIPEFSGFDEAIAAAAD